MPHLLLNILHLTSYCNMKNLNTAAARDIECLAQESRRRKNPVDNVNADHLIKNLPAWKELVIRILTFH